MPSIFLRAAFMAGAATLPVLAPGLAHAQSLPAHPDPQTDGQSAWSFQQWLQQKTMTGDWGGRRTQLANAGVKINASYVGEFADDMSGGKARGGDYAEQWALGAAFDTDKLFGLPGGTIVVNFTFREGASASANEVGNEQAVQEIYGAGETNRITELSYTQALFANKLNVKLGFAPIGNDFAGIYYGTDFQNTGFCAHTLDLPNSSGWADSPSGRLGGRVRVNISKQMFVQAGVYDVNPTISAAGNGFKVGTSGSTGALIPVEFDAMPDFGGLPTHIKIGGFFDTSRKADVINANEVHDGRYGWYAMADQMFLSFDGTPKRGLAAFAVASYTDPETATYRGAIMGGLVAVGPFASRPADFAAIGYVRAVLNQRLVNAKDQAPDSTYDDLSNGEGVVEAGYGFQAAPWLLLHPNVQYVIDPGTFSYKHIPNAWVFGFQIKATI